MPQKIALLGLGSVGSQVVELIRQFPQDFTLESIAVNTTQLDTIIQRFGVNKVSVGLSSEVVRLQREFGIEVRLNSLSELATDKNIDIVVNALSGYAGLQATYDSLMAKKKVVIVNKEPLVAAGEILMGLPGKLISADSEMAAGRELIKDMNIADIVKLIITCSGGPFYDRKGVDLSQITPEEALAHPTWKMGPKITIDSATLINKAFEIIEAHHLFGLPYDKLGMAIHRHSVIHAILRTSEGDTPYISPPSMLIPLAQGLFSPRESLYTEENYRYPDDCTQLQKDPDTSRFPGYELCVQIGREGGLAPAYMVGANEVAVQAFLKRRIRLTDIPIVIERTLGQVQQQADPDLEAIKVAMSFADKSLAKNIIEHPIKYGLIGPF